MLESNTTFFKGFIPQQQEVGRQI